MQNDVTLGKVVRSAIADSERCAEHLENAALALVAVAEAVEQVVEWHQAGAQVRTMAEAINQLNRNMAGLAERMKESLADSEARFRHGQWQN